MQIQVVTYSGKGSWANDDRITLSSIHDARSFDDFDINVIALTDHNMWENHGDGVRSLDCISDLKSLGNTVAGSTQCKTVIFYPQNVMIKNHYYRDRFTDAEELKNVTEDIRTQVLASFIQFLGEVPFYYENTLTVINEVEYQAAFAFSSGDALVKSTSGKTVAIRCGGLFLSTLSITSVPALLVFLQRIGLISEKEKEPAWMAEVNMFDDIRQLDIIRENKEVISRAEDVIAEAKKVLASNQRYKSILYTSGDELAGVVFEILEDLFGVDLSGFVDEKEEDFRFTVGEKVVIGEIKGVGHNVRSENVSQLDVHVQNYIDEHEDVSADDIVALLIMNHQNKKAIQDREPVHDKQIKLAERNKSLIVDTYELLKLYEKYKMNEMPRKDCIAALMDNTGLFKA